MVGSHLDSVFNGGRLDGVLGVVVALEAIQVLTETDRDPERVPTLAVFRGEESARFNQHTIGSRGALGILKAEDFSHTDQNDIPLWLAMQHRGFQPEDLSEPTLDLDRIDRFFETHIEQGRVLDAAGQPLGVVTRIRAPVRDEVTVEGDYDHSGATPMDLRRDALAAAGDCITGVEDAARAVDGVVGTVGDISAHGGAINKVCGRITFPVDIRSHELGPRDEVEADVLERGCPDRDVVCSQRRGCEPFPDGSDSLRVDPAGRRRDGTGVAVAHAD
jgi:hydantoinase/carbamoylase family amidase